MARNYVRKVPFRRYPIKVSNQRYACHLCDVLIMAGDYFHDLSFDKRVHLDCARKADSCRSDISAWNTYSKERAKDSRRICVLCLNKIMKGDLFYNGGVRLKVHISCGDKSK